MAELRRFVAESFIGADGYRRRKGRNKDGSRFVHDCPRRDVSSRLGPSWRSGLGLTQKTVGLTLSITEEYYPRISAIVAVVVVVVVVNVVKELLVRSVIRH